MFSFGVFSRADERSIFERFTCLTSSKHRMAEAQVTMRILQIFSFERLKTATRNYCTKLAPYRAKIDGIIEMCCFQSLVQHPLSHTGSGVKRSNVEIYVGLVRMIHR